MAQLVYECIIYGQQVAHPSLHLLGHHARMLPCRGIRSPVPGQTRVGSWVSKLKMTKRFAGPGGTVSFIRLPARMGLLCTECLCMCFCGLRVENGRAP